MDPNIFLGSVQGTVQWMIGTLSDFGSIGAPWGTSGRPPNRGDHIPASYGRHFRPAKACARECQPGPTILGE